MTVELLYMPDLTELNKSVRGGVYERSAALPRNSLMSLGSLISDMGGAAQNSPGKGKTHSRTKGKVQPMESKPYPGPGGGNEGDCREEFVTDGFLAFRVTDTGAGISVVRW